MKIISRPFIIILAIAIWLALLAILGPQPAHSATRYVKIGGSDGASGNSWANAWATVSKVNSDAAGGDTILFGTGIWRGTVLNAIAGTWTHPTIYACSTWATANPNTGDYNFSRLYGSNQITGWTQIGSGHTYIATLSDPGTYGTLFQGTSGVMLRQSDSASVNAASKWWWGNGHIIGWVIGGDDPDNYDMEMTTDHCIEMSKSGTVPHGQYNVHFWGLGIMYGQQSNIHSAYGSQYGVAYDSVFIDHCKIAYAGGDGGNNVACVMIGATYANETKNQYFCRFRADSVGYSYGWQQNILPQVIGNGAGDGLCVYDYCNGLVDSCWFYGYANPAGLYFKVGDRATDDTIRYNIFTNSGGYGLRFFGCNDNVLVYGNYFINVDVNIGYYLKIPDGNSSYGPLKFTNNTFYNTSSHYILDCNDDEGRCPACYLFHNSIFKYNVIYNAGGTSRVILTPSIPNDPWTYEWPPANVDSNIYYDAGGSLVWYRDSVNRTWSQWTATDGLDAHSDTLTNPQFDTVGTEYFARPSSTPEMNKTYGGHNWYYYGAWQAEKDTLAYGTPKSVGIDAGEHPTLSIPRWKNYISSTDSSHWYLIHGGTAMQTTNSGTSWTTIGSIMTTNMHNSVGGMGDSCFVGGDRANESVMEIINGNTIRNYITINSISEGAVSMFGQPTSNRIWAVYRSFDTYAPYNVQYRYTTNGGTSWTQGWADSIGLACRMGGFIWIGNNPTAVIMSDTGYVRADWNGSNFVRHADSLICNSAESNLNDRRSSAFNGIVNGKDTVFIFVYDPGYALVAKIKWYNGGTGSYITDTVATSSYSHEAGDWHDWEPAMGVVNNTIWLAYSYLKNSNNITDERLYIRWFNPKDTSWSTETLLDNRGYCDYPNGVQSTTFGTSFLTYRGLNDSIYWIPIYNIGRSGQQQAPPPETLTITQNISASSTDSSVTLLDNFGNGTAPYDSTRLYFSATRSNISGLSISGTLYTSVSDPQSITILSLSDTAKYYFRIAAFDAGLYGDTTAIDSILTRSIPPPTGYLIVAESVKVSDTYAGYSKNCINDQVINGEGGTATTWASNDDSTADHWVELYFNTSYLIDRVQIYWAYNSSQLRWMESQIYLIQYWNGSAYVLADSVNNTGATDDSVTDANFASVTTSRIRIFQPHNQGNPYYKRVIWLTEIEVYQYLYQVDTIPPVISNIDTLVAWDSCVIYWNTNEPANSFVDYGHFNGYAVIKSNADFIYDHALVLFPLTASYSYHYRIRSCDDSSNCDTSADYNFWTLEAPPPPRKSIIWRKK